MFLTPGAKFAQKVDVNTSLYNVIAESRGEAAAATTVTACRAFQQLRAALHEPPTTEAVRKGVKCYLAALHYVTNTCKLPSTLSAGLLWVNAFDGDDHCVVQDLAIDHLAALFNLGVCEATLATNSFRTRRTNVNAMPQAAKHFQVAAGYFQAASQLPSPGGIRSVTCDLYPPALRALEMVMLGNAQQVLYEITLEKGNANAILARFAVGAKDFYLIAEECCKEADVVNTCINGYVGRPAGALAAYFDVVAQSAQANAAKDNYDMGQELGRLLKAHESLDVSLNTVTALDTSSLASVANLRKNLIAELKTLKMNVDRRKENAETENRRVFFITPNSNFPDIVGRRSVKSADVSHVVTEEAVDARLRSLDRLPEATSVEVSGVASRYSDMVAKTVADEIAAISATGASLQGLIRQIEASITAARSSAAAEVGRPVQAPVSTLYEDQKAIECVQNLQQKGSLETLRELQSEVLKLATETKFQVQSIETVLENESAEDRQLRSRVYTTRPTSAAMSLRYSEQLSAIRSKLEQAANADKIMSTQIDHHAKSISLASSIDLFGFFPPSADGSSSKHADEPQRVNALIAGMVPEIANAKAILSDKNSLVKEFEKKKQLENSFALTRSIDPGDAEVDKCQAILDQEYGKLKLRAKLACEEMTRISQFLSDSDSRLRMPAPKDETGNQAQAKMNEVYKHQAAALKFKELMGHLEHGTHFYAKEQDVVDTLKRDIQGFAAARHTEAEEILKMTPPSGGSVGDGNPYPPGPPQYPSSNPYPSNGQYQNSYGGQAPHQGAPGPWRRM